MAIKNLDYSNMKESIKHLRLFLFILLVASCKQENEVETNIFTNDGLYEKVIEYEIHFPDTILVNKSVDGVINYKSILDTITTTFGQKDINRYTRFILVTTDNIDYDYKRLREIAKDTFGAINNRTIPFYDIKFSKPGIYYIDGLINDIVLIDLFKKDDKGNELVRLIEHDKRITHKVVVVENSKLSD